MSAAADDMYRDADFWDTMEDRKRLRGRQAPLRYSLSCLREELAILDAAAAAEQEASADEVETAAPQELSDWRRNPEEALALLDRATQAADELMGRAPEQAGSPSAELAADKRGDCAALLETIASLLMRQDRPEEAEPLLRRALGLLCGMREWAPFVPEHNIAEALCCHALALIAAIHERDRAGAEKWAMREIGILDGLQRNVRDWPPVFEMLNHAQWNLYKALGGKTAPEDYRLQPRPLAKNQPEPLPIKPNDVHGAEDLLRSFHDRAATRLRSRNPVRAMAILDRAVEIWERYLPEDARSTPYGLEMTLAIFLEAVGHMTFAENKSKFRAGMIQGAEVGRRLLALLPECVDCLTAAAWCHEGLGMIFQQDHRPRAAIQQHLSAIALLEAHADLAAQAPAAEASARVHAAVASVYSLVLNDNSSALPHAQKCCALRQTLWAGAPTVADRVNELAESLGVVPALHTALGERAAAAQTAQEETLLLERLRELAPKNVKVAAAAGRLQRAVAP
jgi:tetratricopeptide (TPR) repeat protein